jgi:hypothetical protein
MLNLPPKRWKKVHLTEHGPGNYTLTFVSPLRDRPEFLAILHDDIEMCLDEGDQVTRADWERRRVELEIADGAAFRRRLIYVNILIEEPAGP